MALVRLLAVVNGKQRQIEVDFDTVGLPTVIQRPLTQEEISLGLLELGKVPALPTQTTLTWMGVSQRYGADFVVEGDKLIFSSTFSSLSEAGDFITVQF